MERSHTVSVRNNEDGLQIEAMCRMLCNDDMISFNKDYQLTEYYERNHTSGFSSKNRVPAEE